MLVTYIGPGHVEIIDVEVFIGQETSQLRVLLRKVRLYISRYHGKCGISLWVIGYIPRFELAVKHLEINH